MRDDEEIIRESESQSFEEKKSELDEQKLKEAEKQRKKEHKQSPDKEDAVELGLTLKEEKALRRKFGREPPTTVSFIDSITMMTHCAINISYTTIQYI